MEDVCLEPVLHFQEIIANNIDGLSICMCACVQFIITDNDKCMFCLISTPAFRLRVFYSYVFLAH